MALTREFGSGHSQATDHPSMVQRFRTCMARMAFAAGLAMGLALPNVTSSAHAANPDSTAIGVARLALLPPLVGAAEGVRRHDHAGVALEGFDPVTYFLGDRPRPGDATFEAIWGGHAWRFASAANRAAFLSRPDVYAPRLGGHDALAMTRGRVVEAEARIAAIVSGRLYLFHSRAARDAFLDDPDAAALAERIWNESKERLARL
ncbi:MAG: hypothetical protein JJU21_10020 [Salinarimonas sp.]|nr:hypothetical protein [Salinarimonas sp.]